MSRRDLVLSAAVCAAVWFAVPRASAAQAPTPLERIGFQQAIDRAVRNNPTVAVAAAGILRAEGLIAQARAATRLQVTGNLTTTTLNTGVEFQGSAVTPQNQLTASVTVAQPIIAAAAWARRTQAEDNRAVAELSTANIRRQIALATADAYLSVLAAERVVEANVRARDTARAHADLARQQEQQGTGSRLNRLRAEQQKSTDEVLLESTRLAVYRAQEALGVLTVAGGPVEVDGEPTFAIPADALEIAAQPTDLAPDLFGFRADLKLLAGQQSAAERVLRDSSRDRWPSLDAVFLPQTLYPSGFFTPANSWRFLLQASVPIFDSGQRTSLRVQRQAALDTVLATIAGTTTQATSEVRAGREAVASGERSLMSAKTAADQAQEVVTIVNVSFRAGAATNIEVIDAERTARDADTAVANAEDILRRARLELLSALGRFP